MIPNATDTDTDTDLFCPGQVSNTALSKEGNLVSTPGVYCQRH